MTISLQAASGCTAGPVVRWRGKWMAA